MSDTDVLKALNVLRRHGELPLFYTCGNKIVFLPDVVGVKISGDKKSGEILQLALGDIKMEMVLKDSATSEDFVEQWKRAKLWYASR